MNYNDESEIKILCQLICIKLRVIALTIKNHQSEEGKIKTVLKELKRITSKREEHGKI